MSNTHLERRFYAARIPYTAKMRASLDEEGRLQLPEDVPERYGRRFRIVQLANCIKLIPLSEDPTKGLQEALDPIGSIPREEIGERIEADARSEAIDGLR